MSDLEPITRNEKLWSGENLEPKTRREMYIRHLYDETQVIPDSPKTREEMFILKAGEELHDVTIEQLTATENGTYSEEGVAYSPVIVEVPEPTLISKSITANGNYSASTDNADDYSSVSVNVPLPENAYLLQTIEHESIATFADGTDNFLKSLEVAIEPVQSGSGDPSPTNIRPISGWDEVNVTVADDLENPTTSNVYTIDLDGTRYGGKLDVLNGVLTITHEIKKVNTLNWYYLQNTFYSGSVGISADGSPDINSDFVCSFAKSVNKEWNQLSNNECTLRKNLYSQGYYSLCVKNTEYTDATDFKNSLDSSCEITFSLATPIEVQLSPTIIKSLQGENNLFASTGEVIKLQYWGKEVS